ncbi:uncharacterized protein [Nicotiana sylvestris]|uniref:uncharacterized protein n=1 Tax=Nicotiana sylvestris TaxID=4096 RepID=UPI00388C79C7
MAVNNEPIGNLPFGEDVDDDATDEVPLEPQANRRGRLPQNNVPVPPLPPPRAEAHQQLPNVNNYQVQRNNSQGQNQQQWRSQGNQEDEIPSNVVRANKEVRIDIDERVEESQEEVNPSREHMIDMPESMVPKAKAPMSRPPPLYTQSLAKKNSENQFKKFINMMKSLSINVPMVEALEQMPGYAKFIKDLVTKKRSMNCETINMTYQVSAIVHSMASKLEDLSAFTIPCTIGSADYAKALCDLGENINLMPYSMFKTLEIGKPRPTSMRLLMADQKMKRTLGIIDDVLVRVDKFILLADFVILDFEVDYEVPIILGRPFLATGKAFVDVEAGELTFWVSDKKVGFHVCKSMLFIYGFGDRHDS